MGIGDQILASGMARGAAARGKRIAFGDGDKIIWDHHSEMVFRGNPNIAAKGSERIPHLAKDLQWVPFYRGSRIYNTQGNGRWLWNMSFRATPGEFFFTPDELTWADRSMPRGVVVIEPNVPEFKTVAPNKQWPVERYQFVADVLRSEGHQVVQFVFGPGYHIAGAKYVKTPTFRHAAASLARASLYIGPEGGMHHAAAAVGIPAVVLFGGFIPPQVTGYDTHINLTGGAEACGIYTPCDHCAAAMRKIKTVDVIGAAHEILKREAA